MFKNLSITSSGVCLIIGSILGALIGSYTGLAVCALAPLAVDASDENHMTYSAALAVGGILTIMAPTWYLGLALVIFIALMWGMPRQLYKNILVDVSDDRFEDNITKADIHIAPIPYVKLRYPYGIAPIQLSWDGVKRQGCCGVEYGIRDGIPTYNENMVYLSQRKAGTDLYTMYYAPADNPEGIWKEYQDVVTECSRTDVEGPYRASEGACAYDLPTDSYVYYCDDNRLEVNTAIAMAIPKGYVGLLVPRSSTAKKGLLMSNSVGVIDSDYRGPIIGIFKDVSLDTPIRQRIGIGDRLLQLIVVPAYMASTVEVDELPATSRGTGGWGSTGR